MFAHLFQLCLHRRSYPPASGAGTAPPWLPADGEDHLFFPKLTGCNFSVQCFQLWKNNPDLFIYLFVYSQEAGGHEYPVRPGPVRVPAAGGCQEWERWGERALEPGWVRAQLQCSDLNGRPPQAPLASPAFQVRNRHVGCCRKHGFVKLWDRAGAAGAQAAPRSIPPSQRWGSPCAGGIDQDELRRFRYRCAL